LGRGTRGGPIGSSKIVSAAIDRIWRPEKARLRQAAVGC
jgi:hypothetical protein